MSNYQESGKIRRRPNPHSILNRLNNISKPIETPEKNSFAAEIPIGSVVWEDQRKVTYGTTISGGIYDDPRNSTVFVDEINGEVGYWGG